MKITVHRLPGSLGKLRGATKTLEKVGTDGASWAMISEQGLALKELLGMKTSHEREAQGESGGQQSQPTVGAARRDAVPPSSEFSNDDGGSRERERVPAKAGTAKNAVEMMAFEKGATAANALR